MTDEPNNPNPPVNRPVPPLPKRNAEGLAPWEIGQTNQQPPSSPTGAQPPKPNSQGLAPWEIGQTRSDQAAGTRYSQQPGGYIQPGAYQARAADDFQVSAPSDIGRKIGVAALCFVFLALGWTISYELVPTNVYPPAGYVKYVSADGRFSIDEPKGWSVMSYPADPSSDSTTGEAAFRDGSGKIQVASDTVGDLKGNVLLNSAAALPPDFTADPAAAEHDYQKRLVAATMKNYTETPLPTLPTHFEPAIVSEFTGIGGFAGLGGTMHGYRASVSDGSNVFEIVLQCPQKSWAAMSPSFLHVIQSIGPASGGAFTPPADSGSPTPGIPAVPGAPDSSASPGAGGAAGVSTGQGDDAGP